MRQNDHVDLGESPELRTCAACASQQDSSTTFCIHCGQPAEPKCARCQAALSADQAFCTECGAPRPVDSAPHVPAASPQLRAPSPALNKKAWHNSLFARLLGAIALAALAVTYAIWNMDFSPGNSEESMHWMRIGLGLAFLTCVAGLMLGKRTWDQLHSDYALFSLACLLVSLTWFGPVADLLTLFVERQNGPQSAAYDVDIVLFLAINLHAKPLLSSLFPFLTLASGWLAGKAERGSLPVVVGHGCLAVYVVLLAQALGSIF